MKQADSQSLPIKSVNTLAKMAIKDAKSTIIGVLIVFCFIFLYGWIKAEKRKDEVVDTYNVLIFGLVRDVNQNGKEIESIKPREVKDTTNKE